MRRRLHVHGVHVDAVDAIDAVDAVDAVDAPSPAHRRGASLQRGSGERTPRHHSNKDDQQPFKGTERGAGPGIDQAGGVY